MGRELLTGFGIQRSHGNLIAKNIAGESVEQIRQAKGFLVSRSYTPYDRSMEYGRFCARSVGNHLDLNMCLWEANEPTP